MQQGIGILLFELLQVLFLKDGRVDAVRVQVIPRQAIARGWEDSICGEGDWDLMILWPKTGQREQAAAVR